MTEEEKRALYNFKLKFLFWIIVILTLIAIVVFTEPFSASPNSYLNNARVPSNPLSHIVYPFYQPLKWWQLPTGATQMTTIQGNGKV